MNLDRISKAARGDFSIKVADIGSLGGLHPRWSPLRRTVAGMLFDPRETGAAGRPRRGEDVVIPSALGEKAGETTLHVTELRNMSSTLPPNRALMDRFRKKRSHTRIVGNERISVDTMDAIAHQRGFFPDVLKADSQGSELAILKGSTACLEQSVIFIEVEVSFFERYKGQPLFREIEGFLAGFGFELIDLYRLKRYRLENNARLNNLSLGLGQRAGRLAYGDALFLVNEETAEERLKEMNGSQRSFFTLKTVLILIAYGKADFAANWYARHRNFLDANLKNALEAQFRSIAKRRYFSGHVYKLFDYLSRKL